MVCYLQPECVVCPLKAAVGEDVLTAYGEGRVAHYNYVNDVYTIVLDGWNGKLYAKGFSFDRCGEGIQDRDGSFGVNWFLKFLFDGAATIQSNTKNSRPSSVRSRSGSISSRSVTSSVL